MPSTVKVDVWNRALDRIGETEPIEDEDEDRLAAVVCRRHFDDCLGEALEIRGGWQFAKKQAKPNENVNIARAGWRHTYTLPVDFAAARALLQGGRRSSLEPEESRIPYEIQASDDGERFLFCTDADLSSIDALEYTSNAIAVGIWPRLFLSAVVWRLAVELALAIKKDTKLADGCLKLFDAAIAVAHAADGRGKSQPDQDLEAPSIRARGDASGIPWRQPR